jgi:hypothetical protein
VGVVDLLPAGGERLDDGRTHGNSPIQFIFRCYDANDPSLQSPEMRPTQRLIIEDD